MRVVVLLVLVPAGLTGCASSPDGDSPLPPLDASGSPAEAFLQVAYDPGDGTEPESWTLVCDGRDDDAHPDPAAACAHLRTLEDPFAPLPDDVACTEQYGGPQTAHVIGRWDGEPVDLELSRVDGCRISQWDGLVPLLPAVDGAVPFD